MAGIGDALNQGLQGLIDKLNEALGGPPGGGPQPDAQPGDDPNANDTPTPPPPTGPDGQPLEDWPGAPPPADTPPPPADNANPIDTPPASTPPPSDNANPIDTPPPATTPPPADNANPITTPPGQSVFGPPTGTDSTLGDASAAASSNLGLAPADAATPWGQNLGNIGVPGVGGFGDSQGIGSFAPSDYQNAVNAIHDAPFADGIPGMPSLGFGGMTSEGVGAPYGISGIASSAEQYLGGSSGFDSQVSGAVNDLSSQPTGDPGASFADRFDAAPSSLESQLNDMLRSIDTAQSQPSPAYAPAANGLSASDLAIPFGGAAAAGAGAAAADSLSQSDRGIEFQNPVAPNASATDLATQAAAQAQQNLAAAQAAQEQIPNTSNTPIQGSDPALPQWTPYLPPDPITQMPNGQIPGSQPILPPGFNDAGPGGLGNNPPLSNVPNTPIPGSQPTLPEGFSPAPPTYNPGTSNVPNTPIPGSQPILPPGFNPVGPGGLGNNPSLPNVPNTQIPGSQPILQPGFNPAGPGGLGNNPALDASDAIEQAISPKPKPPTAPTPEELEAITGKPKGDASSAKAEPAPRPRPAPAPITQRPSAPPQSSGSLGTGSRISAGSNLNTQFGAGISNYPFADSGSSTPPPYRYVR